LRRDDLVAIVRTVGTDASVICASHKEPGVQVRRPGLQRLARLVAAELCPLSNNATSGQTTVVGWLDAKAAARYLGFDGVNPLHKLTSQREISFSQDTPGGKMWFRQADLDNYRLQGYIDTLNPRT
jgi:hypothetical protein